MRGSEDICFNISSGLSSTFTTKMQRQGKQETFFYKELDSKCFRLGGPLQSLSQILNSVAVQSSHSQYVNEWTWLSSSKSLFMGHEFGISGNVYIAQDVLLLIFFPI